jgi:hypothetical protein
MKKLHEHIYLQYNYFLYYDMLKDVIITYIEYVQLGLKAAISLTEEHWCQQLILIKL